MIIIVSSYLDLSTQKVVDYLAYCKADFLLINNYNKIKDIEITIKNNIEKIYLSIDNRKVDLSEIKSFWFRSGNLKLENFILSNAYPKTLKNNFNNFINYEQQKLKEYLNFKFKKKV